MLLRRFPSLSIIYHHPIIDAIFHFTSVLKSRSEKTSQIVVVWFIFKAEIANIAQVFVEFICFINQREG